MLSVIIPVYNEEKYIEQCIQCIIAQDYDKADLEVLFVDGLSTDTTADIIQHYAELYPYIHLLHNPHRIVPYAMNIGINEAKGDIIMRLDAHSGYSTKYFSTLTRYLAELHADNVGAVCHTDVLHPTAKALAIKEVLCHPFGVGNSAFRTGISTITAVDTVPFGCFRRDVFTRYGMYNTALVRNQDIELNKRILAHGGKIMLIPEALCTYYARETLHELAHNNYLNGLWNVLTVKITRQTSSLSVRHFIPLLFLLSLLIPAIAALFYTPCVYISLLSLCLYIGFLIATCLSIAKQKHCKFLWLCFTFVVLHFSYATGSLIGIFKTVKS